MQHVLPSIIKIVGTENRTETLNVISSLCQSFGDRYSSDAFSKVYLMDTNDLGEVVKN